MPRLCPWKSSRPLSCRHAAVLKWTVLLVAIPASAALGQDSLPPSITVHSDSLPQTHTVRKGDTLWDLAQHYLKDPFLWPGIFRQNTDVVEDPHWIYPGEVLRIAPVDNVAAVPTMDTPVPPPTRASADSANTGDSTIASATPDSTDALARGPQQPSLAEESDQQPLFSSERPRSVAEILKAYTDQPYRALRRNEFYSSGFLTENQHLPYGRVLGPVTPQQI
jgi:LysM repeat protein